MRFLRLLAPLAALAALSGCHSAFIEATVANRTSSVILLIEVDYPSASFGTENLAPGRDFHYRLKVLGDGPVKVVYTDNGQHDHTIVGPSLREGDEGALTITFLPDGVHWQAPAPRSH